MKYRVTVNNRIFSETNNFSDALAVFRKLDRAGMHPAIIDKYGIIKE